MGGREVALDETRLDRIGEAHAAADPASVVVGHAGGGERRRRLPPERRPLPRFRPDSAPDGGRCGGDEPAIGRTDGYDYGSGVGSIGIAGNPITAEQDGSRSEAMAGMVRENRGASG